MTLDICIPTYNAREKLEACVASVLRHTDMADKKLTIINDASTDDTAAYLARLTEKYPAITAINLQQNHFKCRPLNMALQNASGEFVALLDDDTEVTPGWLDSLLATIAPRKDVGMVGAKIVFPDGNIFAAEHRLPAHLSMGEVERDLGQRDYIRECDALVGTCVLMRTELFRTVGAYDESLRWHEDIDYSARARLAGYKLIYNGTVKIYHHHLGRESGDPAKNLAAFEQKWQTRMAAFPLADSHIADRLFAAASRAMEGQHWQEAITHLDTLERQDTRWREPFWKGKCLYMLGDFAQAAPCLSEAKDRAPGNVTCRTMLIQCYKHLGNAAMLRAEADAMLAIVPAMYQKYQAKP